MGWYFDLIEKLIELGGEQPRWLRALIYLSVGLLFIITAITVVAFGSALVAISFYSWPTTVIVLLVIAYAIIYITAGKD